jgi:hypothetical protein
LNVEGNLKYTGERNVDCKNERSDEVKWNGREKRRYDKGVCNTVL